MILILLLFGVVFCVVYGMYTVVKYLDVSLSGFITSTGEESVGFFS